MWSLTREATVPVLPGAENTTLKAFGQWRIMSVPFAVVVNEGGMVVAKGQLLGEVGRLAQMLGVERDPNAAEATKKGAVAT